MIGTLTVYYKNGNVVVQSFEYFMIDDEYARYKKIGPPYYCGCTLIDLNYVEKLEVIHGQAQ